MACQFQRLGLVIPIRGVSNSGLDANALTALAEQAGGLFAYANDAKTLKNIYELYGYLFKSEYSVSYTTPAELRDGIRRSLRVEVGDEISSSGTGKTDYNPGGVLPEVETGEAWRLFVILLAALGALLILPMVIRLVSQRAEKKPSSAKKSTKGSHVTIKPPPKIVIK